MELTQIARDPALTARLTALRDGAADAPALLAIDGRSGSGKSTLAGLLQTLYGAQVIHMDDFFLPAERKTPQRLAQPGGNVDIERVLAEVLAPLREGRPARFRPFHCHGETRFGDPVTVAPRGLIVVEGSYSMHPLARACYDASVFLRLSPALQRSRILARNGADMLRRFETEWIPLEEAYFAACGTETACAFAFDVTDE